jgi:hypothetical protein
MFFEILAKGSSEKYLIQIKIQKIKKILDKKVNTR